MGELTLRPIGVVHSPVGEGGEIPIEGAAAQAEVHADCAEGLHDIAAATRTFLCLVGCIGRRRRYQPVSRREACSGCAHPHAPI
jgi:tRNA (Thr-GGU) A37 N-methylase